MDLNIGAALWLASGACGQCLVQSPSQLSSSEQPAVYSTMSAAPSAADSALPSAWSSRPEGCSSTTQQRQQQQHGSHQHGQEPWRVEAASTHLQALAVGSDAGLGPGQQMLPGWWRSTARAMLLGQGADEACGGYGRYRTRFREQVSCRGRGMLPTLQHLYCDSPACCSQPA